MLGKHWAYLYEIVEVMKVRRAFCELYLGFVQGIVWADWPSKMGIFS